MEKLESFTDTPLPFFAGFFMMAMILLLLSAYLKHSIVAIPVIAFDLCGIKLTATLKG
jgi:hypothetical protein